jgi:DNA-binding IscR family transcriptional regulator
MEDCAVRPVWADIQEELVKRLKSSTFDQFLKK